MPSATEPFCVSPAWGFLNLETSLATLPPRFDGLLVVAKNMGSMLKKHQLRPYFDNASAIELPNRLTKRQEQLLFTIYAMLASAYLFSIHEAEELLVLPPSLAVPLHYLATQLGVPPILSYDAYVYNNFTQDRQNPTLPESYTPMFTFSAPEDEEQHQAEKWFIARRVAAERIIGPCVAGLLETLEHLEQGGDSRSALYFLHELEHALATMARSLSPVDKEGRDSDRFQLEIRQYLRPFDGVVFDGVPGLRGNPQHLRGATDAQSPVPRSIEAFLGLPSGDQVDAQLEEYVSPEHRKYVEKLLSHKSLRHHLGGQTRLFEVYSSVLAEFTELRAAQPDPRSGSCEAQRNSDKTDQTLLKESQWVLV